MRRTRLAKIITCFVALLIFLAAASSCKTPLITPSTPPPTSTPFSTPITTSSTPVTPPPSPLNATELLNRTNEAMAGIPGFHFSLTQHFKANTNDLTDIMTIKTEGDGKPGGDLLQYATMTYVGSQQSITIETRVVNGQAYNLNPVTNHWDVVPGGPYAPNEPVMMLLKGQLILQNMQVTNEKQNGVSFYCVNGLPQSTFDMTTFSLWIDSSNYLAVKIDSVGSEYISLPGLPSDAKAVIVEHWEFAPLKEPFVVNIPEVTPLLTPTATSPLPEDNQILAMILTEQCKGSNQYFVVAPKTSAGIIYLDEKNMKDRLVKEFNNRGYNFVDLINLLFELNRESVPLTIPSSSENGYSIDYEDKFHQYPNDDLDAFWKQWHLDNPQAFGYMFISVPAIDPSTGYILVVVGMQWGALAGTGDLIAYRYLDGKLIILGTLNLWLS